MKPTRILVFLSLALASVWSCDKDVSADQSNAAPAAANTPAMAGDAANGKSLFAEKTCSACHKMDGKVVGPPLRGVVDKRGQEWVFEMIQNPDSMVESDPTAKKMLAEYNNVPMPNLGLSDAETRDIVAYLKTQN